MPHRKELKQNLKLVVIAVIFILILGTVLFSALEGWSYVDSFYFVTMTATTVGYGDFIPTHTVSKIITIIYSLAIIPFFLYAFSIVAKFQVESVNRKLHGVARKVNEQEEELEKTDRKIVSTRHKLKEKEVEMEALQKKLRRQERITREQTEELEGHQRKIRDNRKDIREQEEEIQDIAKKPNK